MSTTCDGLSKTYARLSHKYTKDTIRDEEERREARFARRPPSALPWNGQVRKSWQICETCELFTSFRCHHRTRGPLARARPPLPRAAEGRGEGLSRWYGRGARAPSPLARALLPIN